MRYVALFHEVTETSLLTITKYDLKRTAALMKSQQPQDDLILSIEAAHEKLLW
jgi:hypothetical protein